MMSVDRKARIANGLLVLLGSVLTIAVDSAFGWTLVFMGVSLMVSGIADFCGFAVIFAWFSNSK